MQIYISQSQYIKCAADVSDIHIAVAIYKVRCRYTYRSRTIRESVDSLSRDDADMKKMERFGRFPYIPLAMVSSYFMGVFR